MRARGDDPMDNRVAAAAEGVQVAAKPKRRTYTAEYKRRILKAADACATPGAVGALLRREGLYSSHLVLTDMRKRGIPDTPRNLAWMLPSCAAAARPIQGATCPKMASENPQLGPRAWMAPTSSA